MLQNNWPLTIKSAMVMKAKKRLNTEGDVMIKCNRHSELDTPL